MTDEIRNRALEAHNYRRSRLANGFVKNKNKKNLPKASDMLEMIYSCEMENTAMASAKRCSIRQDPTLPPDVQENHYLVPKDSASQTSEQALITAIKHWWSQIRETGGIGHGVTFTSYNLGKPIEWFTRMAWATTQYVGCAATPCGSNLWGVVCHYKPGGNKLGQHLYKKGDPCTACPPSYQCTERKLCSPA
ncbi:SCP-like protein [Teladorsagia circumcincta]|uniref:SCP-like protein n=1 Tax=Teladorsagia circumcincta TaxID=45464 RepID=A0A2G9U7L2_TELCI|nr:SCP-like protein [Teladorsagia circumcincta]